MNPGTDILRNNIKFMRESKKLTQEDLAERAGVSVQEVSKIERGKVNPRVNVVLKIAKGLEIEPMWLFDYHLNRENLFLCPDEATDQIMLSLTRMDPEDRQLILSIVGLFETHIKQKHNQHV